MNNSQLAYKQHTESGYLPSIQCQVYEAMKVLKVASKGQIARFLHKTQDQVHKRLSSLKNEGKIKPSGESVIDSETKSRQTIWELVENISEGS